MHHVNARLEMLIRRNVLVVSRRGDVVGEADAVVVGAKVHVEKALVGAVKGLAILGFHNQTLVLAQVGLQHHDARVEDVRPSDVGCGGERRVDVEELVGGAVRHNIGVYIHDFGELGLLPEVDLGEGRVKIDTVHEFEILRVSVLYSGDGDDMVVDGLGSDQHRDSHST